MGKGDQKSKRGKINRGTSGVRRQKKKKTAIAVVEKPKVTPKKKAAVKKSAPKKATTKKTTTKKATTKKVAAKKPSVKKKAED